MYRTDHRTGVPIDPGVTLPTATPNRYFSGGDPVANTEATIVEAEWLNTIQEELINAVVGGGLTPSKADRTQLSQVIGSRLTVAQGDLRYVRLAGSTMTGPLILSEHPIATSPPLQAATKAYVDSMAPGPGGGIPEAPLDAFTYGRFAAAWNRVLPLAGGTLTGPLILSRDAVQQAEAVTLRQLQSQIVATSGSNFTFAFRQVVPANTPIGTIFTFVVPSGQLPPSDFYWTIDYEYAGAGAQSPFVYIMAGLGAGTGFAGVSLYFEYRADWNDGAGLIWRRGGQFSGSGASGTYTLITANSPDQSTTRKFQLRLAGEDIEVRLVTYAAASPATDAEMTFGFMARVLAYPGTFMAGTVDFPGDASTLPA